MIWIMGAPTKFVRNGRYFVGNPLADIVEKDFDQGNLWKNKILVFELDQIMRQKDEKDWAEFLNKLRETPPSESEWRYMSDRITETDEICLRSNYVTLTNKKADQINQRWYHMAEERYPLNAIARDKHGKDATHFLSRISANQMNNLAPVLNVAIGHEYDFVINLDTQDGLTNGTPCLIKKFQTHPIHGEIIWVEPIDATVGKMHRLKYQPLYALLDDPNKSKWLPVLRMKKEAKVGKETVIIRQFPLRPAKARTVNRTQGATMSYIAADFSDWGPKPHAIYVFCSRTPSKENVTVVKKKGFQAKDVTHDPRCCVEMKRLRTERQLTLRMDCFHDLKQNHKIIVSYNSCSIRNKIQTIESDLNFQKADVLGIIDSRYQENEGDQLSCFDQPPIISSVHSRVTLGQVVFSKETITNDNFKIIEINGQQCASITSIKIKKIFKTNLNFRNIVIFFVYVVPNCLNHVYEKLLLHVQEHSKTGDPIVMMGDLNKNPRDMCRSFMNLAENLKLSQIIKAPTHIQGNTLDHVWTNLNANLVYGNTFETLSRSDHVPIFLAIKD